MNEREAYIALNLLEGMGPVRVRALVEKLGSAAAIFEADVEAIRAVPGIGAQLAGSIVQHRAELDAAAEEEKAARLHGRIIAFVEEAYPEVLRTIHDPPLCLYVWGTLDAKDKTALAVVGTRHASHYGLSVADRLAYQLAKAGVTVVSGMARGIDTAAHKGALKAKGRTLAVLGSALDVIYPPENTELAKAIAESGAVISEFALGRQPDRTTFPYRNRVVSGLSQGVLVVEAGLGSGAMMTADQALEQGRSVLAVPGRVDSAAARGPHKLIKHGARLVEDIEDVLQEFEFLFPPEKTQQAVAGLDARRSVVLSELEQRVIRELWQEELDVDVLIRKCGLPPAQLNPLLIGLEMKRVIRMLPGRKVAVREDLRSMLAPPTKE